jgi:BtpA family
MILFRSWTGSDFSFRLVVAPFLVVVFLLSAWLSQRTQPEASSQEGYVVGGEFVRINVLSGAMVTDQGVIEGNAFEVMRLKDSRPCARQVRFTVAKSSHRNCGSRYCRARPCRCPCPLRHDYRAGCESGRCAMRPFRCPEIPLLIGSGVTVSNGAAYRNGRWPYCWDLCQTRRQSLQCRR